MSVLNDRRILFIESTCDRVAFGKHLGTELDGLVRRAKDSLARQAPNEIEELTRIGLQVSVIEFTIELLVRSTITNITQLPLQRRDLRVTRIGGPERVAAIPERDCLSREVRDEVATKTRWNILPGGFEVG